MVLSTLPSASPHFSSTSMKRCLSLLETSTCNNEEEPASKRHCSSTTTISSTSTSGTSDVIIKTHASFARALDTSTSSGGASSSSHSPLSPSVMHHWGKKTRQERKDFLGKAHINAERFLRHRGVWDGVATILDRHFTQTLQQEETLAAKSEQEATQPTVPVGCPSSATISPTAPVEAAHVDVNAIVENVVSAMCNDDVLLVPDQATSTGSALCSPPLLETTMPNVVSTTSLDDDDNNNDDHHHDAIAKTARGLVVSQATTTTPLVEHITLVPNPLFSVPNPLLEDTTLPAAVPTATTTTTPASDALRVQVPSPVVTSLSQEEVTPVSPLSNDGSHSSPVPPVWCLDEVAFYDKKQAAAAAAATTRNEEWELDPLTLLA